MVRQSHCSVVELVSASIVMDTTLSGQDNECTYQPGYVLAIQVLPGPSRFSYILEVEVSAINQTGHGARYYTYSEGVKAELPLERMGHGNRRHASAEDYDLWPCHGVQIMNLWLRISCRAARLSRCGLGVVRVSDNCCGLKMSCQKKKKKGKQFRASSDALLVPTWRNLNAKGATGAIPSRPLV